MDKLSELAQGAYDELESICSILEESFVIAINNSDPPSKNSNDIFMNAVYDLYKWTVEYKEKGLLKNNLEFGQASPEFNTISKSEAISQFSNFITGIKMYAHEHLKNPTTSTLAP